MVEANSLCLTLIEIKPDLDGDVDLEPALDGEIKLEPALEAAPNLNGCLDD